MAIIKAESQKDNEVKNESLCKARQITSNLTNNLQNFSEKIKSTLTSVDTSDVEEVSYCNTIIEMINNLILKVKQNQPNIVDLVLLDTVNLTDDLGNVVTENQRFCVSIVALENDFTSYYNTRIVVARSEKEAVYKYTNFMNCEIGLAQSLGLYDEHADYVDSITDTEVIM